MKVLVLDFLHILFLWDCNLSTCLSDSTFHLSFSSTSTLLLLSHTSIIIFFRLHHRPPLISLPYTICLCHSLRYHFLLVIVVSLPFFPSPALLALSPYASLLFSDSWHGTIVTVSELVSELLFVRSICLNQQVSSSHITGTMTSHWNHNTSPYTLRHVFIG